MSEPKRVQVIRSHQLLDEFMFEKKKPATDATHESDVFHQPDYHAVGFRRLHQLQSLPLAESWPIVIGNGIGSVSTGIVGGLITHRMGRNLLIHLSSSVLGASGACFLSVAAAHLALYYLTVMRPLCSNDPMLCSTCLEIRAFTIGSATPLVLGTSIAVVANLSTCLLKKTIRLPQFHVRAYPEWARFFEKHAFKGMRTRYFVALPLMSGFLTSVIFVGQNYYWRTYLNQRLYAQEKQTSFTNEPVTSNGKPGSLGSLYTKYFGSKTK